MILLFMGFICLRVVLVIMWYLVFYLIKRNDFFDYELIWWFLVWELLGFFFLYKGILVNFYYDMGGV